MTATDALGLPLSGASAQAAALYDRAIAGFQCYEAGVTDRVDIALEDSPGFVMAHVLRAWVHLTGTEPENVLVASAVHDVARMLPATPRERAHLVAIRCAVMGRWRVTARVWRTSR